MFEAAGLGPLEEDVYGQLLEHHGLLLDDLVSTHGGSVAVLTSALERLEAVGLVTRSPGGESTRYVPAPPDLAIEALVLRRHGELEQLRAHAAALARRYWAAVQRSEHSTLVEVVRGRDAVLQHAMQAQRAARREVLLIDRPPYVDGMPTVNDEELSGLSRGVRYRCLYDTATFDIDDQAKLMFRYVEAGEQARTLPDIPLKMVVVDEELALVPLVLDEPEYRDCAIVRGSTLINALVTCFEALWARAVPVTSASAAAKFDPASLVAPGDDRPTPLERRVVALLAAGVKDDAIARQLDVSSRTVNRYMDRIMVKLGAGTRFQAGLQAQRLGWL